MMIGNLKLLRKLFQHQDMAQYLSCIHLLLQTFLNEAVDSSTEGLIVKTMGDSYEPSKRSSHWLKLKKDYLEGVGDTFDLVPIGAFYGKGKRAGEQGCCVGGQQG